MFRRLRLISAALYVRRYVMTPHLTTWECNTETSTHPRMRRVSWARVLKRPQGTRALQYCEWTPTSSAHRVLNNTYIYIYILLLCTVVLYRRHFGHMSGPKMKLIINQWTKNFRNQWEATVLHKFQITANHKSSNSPFVCYTHSPRNTAHDTKSMHKMSSFNKTWK